MLQTKNNPNCSFLVLEALAVDDFRTDLVVLLFGDPHLLERGEGSQDGAADPGGVFSLRRGDDLQERGNHGSHDVCRPLVATRGIL